MIEDLSALARAVRRLDASATFRSFTIPGALFASWAYLVMLVVQGVEDLYGAELVAVVLVSAAGAAVAPLLAVLYDSFARQNWRPVSGAIALGAGALGHLVYGVGGVLLLGALILLPFDAALRAEAANVWGLLTERGPLIAAAIVLVIVVGYILAPFWIIRRTVQVESLLAGPALRAELMGDLGGTGLWARLAYLFGVPSSLWRAGALARPELWMFIVARVAVYGAFLPVAALVSELSEGFATLTRAGVLVGAAGLLLIVGHVMFATAKRLAARRIWAEPTSSSVARKPILFLRSFEDDQFAFKRPALDLVGRWLGIWSFRRNADEILIDEFARDGAVIALGQPGERRTPFGAARRYVDHDAWQGVVRDAVRDASAIVVAAGESSGLKWEYELLKREDALGKAIFLFPPAQAGSGDASPALRTFRQAFPELAVAPPADKALIAVRTSEDGAQLDVADEPDDTAYLIALRHFVQSRDAAAGYRVGDGPMPVGALIGAAAGLLVGAAAMMAVGQSMFG
jgi:hypothetical protein